MWQERVTKPDHLKGLYCPNCEKRDWSSTTSYANTKVWKARVPVPKGNQPQPSDWLCMECAVKLGVIW